MEQVLGGRGESSIIRYFMGSIGSMMKGSGLEEALETICGLNAVTQMMSGKVVSRTLCGHFLEEAALVDCNTVAMPA